MGRFLHRSHTGESGTSMHRPEPSTTTRPPARIAGILSLAFLAGATLAAQTPMPTPMPTPSPIPWPSPSASPNPVTSPSPGPSPSAPPYDVSGEVDENEI